jgi:integrase
MRRSELCALEVSDLTWVDKGIVALIRRSKTDQTGKGRQVAIPKLGNVRCPVTALQDWLQAGDIHQGPVFRGLKSNGQIRSSALHPCEVAFVVKRAAQALGLDPEKFGGHSLRHGYVTEARRAGVEWFTIMEQTGHRDIQTVKRYAQGSFDPFLTTKVEEVFKAFAAADGDV